MEIHGGYILIRDTIFSGSGVQEHLGGSESGMHEHEELESDPEEQTQHKSTIWG